ncbi:MAG: PfkB family carbohydrate kinase [Thalassobaculaceae bacterium]
MSPDPSRYATADLPLEALGRTRIVQLSGISQAIGEGPCAAADALIDAARAAGCEVAYDTNLRLKLWDLDRARDVMHASLSRCTIALPSIDDSRILTGLEEAHAIVDAYLAMGPRIVALKMGEEGAMIATAGERVHVPPHPVAPVDATGAGDTFDGTFLARLAAGDDPVTAGRYAAVAAALTTTGYGAVTPIPTSEQIVALQG